MIQILPFRPSFPQARSLSFWSQFRSSTLRWPRCELPGTYWYNSGCQGTTKFWLCSDRILLVASSCQFNYLTLQPLCTHWHDHAWPIPQLLPRGWGEVSDTRGVEDELLDIRYIASSYGAFVALRGDGRVVSWGDRNYGTLAQSNRCGNLRWAIVWLHHHRSIEFDSMKIVAVPPPFFSRSLWSLGA